MGRGAGQTSSAGSDQILYGNLGSRGHNPLSLPEDYLQLLEEVDLEQLSLEEYFEEFYHYSGTEQWGAKTELLPSGWDQQMGRRCYLDSTTGPSEEILEHASDILFHFEACALEALKPVKLLSDSSYDHEDTKIAVLLDSFGSATKEHCDVNTHQCRSVEALAGKDGEWRALNVNRYDKGSYSGDSQEAILVYIDPHYSDHDQPVELLGWVVGKNN